MSFTPSNEPTDWKVSGMKALGFCLLLVAIMALAYLGVVMFG